MDANVIGGIEEKGHTCHCQSSIYGSDSRSLVTERFPKVLTRVKVISIKQRRGSNGNMKPVELLVMLGTVLIRNNWAII